MANIPTEQCVQTLQRKERISVYGQYHYRTHIYYGQYINGTMPPDPPEEIEDGRLRPVPLPLPSPLSLHSGSALSDHSGAYAFISHVYQLNATSPYIGIVSIIVNFIYVSFPQWSFQLHLSLQMNWSLLLQRSLLLPHLPWSMLLLHHQISLSLNFTPLLNLPPFLHLSLFPILNLTPTPPQAPASAPSPVTSTGDAGSPHFDINDIFIALDYMEVYVKYYSKINNFIVSR